jgi:glutathione S-transferase
VIEWLMFQVSGLGPMMGQTSVFYRYAPEEIRYAIERYQREGKRVVTVLDTQLAVKRAAPPMPPVTADKSRLDAAVKIGQKILG